MKPCCRRRCAAKRVFNDWPLRDLHGAIAYRTTTATADWRAHKHLSASARCYTGKLRFGTRCGVEDARRRVRACCGDEDARRSDDGGGRCSDKDAIRSHNEDGCRSDDEDAHRSDDEDARCSDDEHARCSDDKDAHCSDDEDARRSDDKDARCSDDEDARRSDEEDARRSDDEDVRRSDDEDARRSNEEDARRSDGKWCGGARVPSASREVEVAGSTATHCRRSRRRRGWAHARERAATTLQLKWTNCQLSA